MFSKSSNRIVSDYDQTLYISNQDIEINKKEIKKFRGQGNIFVIATGRSYLDFNNKKELYNIEYDYVILNHGATILDSNGNIISNSFINSDIIGDLKADLDISIASRVFCCSLFESRVDFDYGNLTKIHVGYNTREIAMDICDKLNRKYSKYINAYYVTGNGVEIISNKVDKSAAIELLASQLQLPKDNIYTIVDGYSDIEMIRNFNGYCMENSVEELKLLAKKKYSSVSLLVKDLMGGKLRNE